MFQVMFIHYDPDKQRLFTSNVARFPSSGMPVPLRDNPNVNYARMGRPTWYHGNLAAVPFFPTDASKLRGTIFASVAFRARKDINVQPVGPGYRTKYAEEWVAVEQFLMKCRDELSLSMSHGLATHASLEARSRDLPSKHLYHLVSTEEVAKEREFLARREMAYLLGEVAANIYLFGCERRGSHEWYDFLASHPNVHPPLLAHPSVRNPGVQRNYVFEQMSLSVATDFSLEAGRAGVFLDTSNREHLSRASLYLGANVPVFFFWGNPDGKTIASASSFSASIRPYVPTMEDIQARRYRLCQSDPPSLRQDIPTLRQCPSISAPESVAPWYNQASSSTLAHSTPTASTSLTAAGLTSLSASATTDASRGSWGRNSIQTGFSGGNRFSWDASDLSALTPVFAARPRRPKDCFLIHYDPRLQADESLFDYFERRITIQKHYENSVEKPEARQLRLSRKAHAAGWTLAKTDILVEWVFDNLLLGPRRLEVTKNEMEKSFMCYPPWHKRYDPFTGIWDCCDRFYMPAKYEHHDGYMHSDERHPSYAEYERLYKPFISDIDLQALRHLRLPEEPEDLRAHLPPDPLVIEKDPCDSASPLSSRPSGYGAASSRDCGPRAYLPPLSASGRPSLSLPPLRPAHGHDSSPLLPLPQRGRRYDLPPPTRGYSQLLPPPPMHEHGPLSYPPHEYNRNELQRAYGPQVRRAPTSPPLPRDYSRGVREYRHEDSLRDHNHRSNQSPSQRSGNRRSASPSPRSSGYNGSSLSWAGSSSRRDRPSQTPPTQQRVPEIVEPDCYEWEESLDIAQERYFWKPSEAEVPPKSNQNGVTSLLIALKSIGISVPPVSTQSDIERVNEIALHFGVESGSMRSLWGFVASLARNIKNGSLEVSANTFALHKAAWEVVIQGMEESELSAVRCSRPAAMIAVEAIVKGKGNGLTRQNDGPVGPTLNNVDSGATGGISSCWLIDEREKPRKGRDWVIVLNSPLAVVWALRSRCTDLQSLALRLVAEGIPFWMPIPRTARIAPTDLSTEAFMRRAREAFLGRREPEYQFTREDFIEYECIRNRFLRDNRRVARLALLSGGILWRLAVAAISEKNVLEGPSEYAVATEDRLQWCFAASRDSDQLYDDRLLDAEVYLIIGRYGQQNTSGDESVPSFFPGPRQWNASSYGLLGWNGQAERFYQNRRAHYLHPETFKGSAHPTVVVASRWRTAIGSCGQAKFVNANVEAAAAAFMDENACTFEPRPPVQGNYSPHFISNCVVIFVPDGHPLIL
jgi:hypothetical protein